MYLGLDQSIPIAAKQPAEFPLKYSMPRPTSQKQYTELIIQALREVNPYTSQEGRIGYVYAAGYLASYLASLSTEDPYIYKRFLEHIKQQRAKR